MTKSYRRGPVGALMDEYERAAAELGRLVERIPEDDVVRVVDSRTEDDDCRSVQTIMSHVVNAGYGYADYLRAVFAIPSARPPKRLLTPRESLAQLDAMLAYTAETLADRWEMPDEEIMGAVIHSGWGVRYDAEQLLEHAVVHVLRHRRQVERFIAQGLIQASAGADSSA
ncbi:MAG TPA: DinB family protein [Pyrinomonadaceae bacterium]|nr:DinB family protein [Pyrinomonadaceae bacterium]